MNSSEYADGGIRQVADSALSRLSFSGFAPIGGACTDARTSLQSKTLVTLFWRRGTLKQLLIMVTLVGLLVPGLMASDHAWAAVNGHALTSGDLVKGPATIQFLDGTKMMLAKDAAVTVTNGYQPTVQV